MHERTEVRRCKVRERLGTYNEQSSKGVAGLQKCIQACRKAYKMLGILRKTISNRDPLML